MYKHARILSLFLLMCCLSTTVSYARWGLPIQPGDHVIDLKRLHDSAIETSKLVLEYTQEVTKLRNRLLLLTGVTGLENRITAALDHFQQQLSGRSIITLKNEYADDPAQRAITPADLMYHGYLQELLRAQQDVTIDHVTALQQGAGRTQERAALAQQILTMEDTGEVGTRQKAAALQALAAIQENDESQLAAADTFAAIEHDEIGYATERLEQEELSQQQWYAYNPYHPTDYDLKHNKHTTENFGFLSTMDTGQ